MARCAAIAVTREKAVLREKIAICFQGSRREARNKGLGNRDQEHRNKSVSNRIRRSGGRGRGRGRWGRRGAVAGGENCGNVFEAHVAAGDVEHGADQVAHHVVQKSVAAHAIDE